MKIVKMKFDICIMNPPYGQSEKDTDKNLHVKFLSLTTKIANTIISI
jgi:predicted RNA methylase